MSYTTKRIYLRLVRLRALFQWFRVPPIAVPSGIFARGFCLREGLVTFPRLIEVCMGCLLFLSSTLAFNKEKLRPELFPIRGLFFKD